VTKTASIAVSAAQVTATIIFAGTDSGIFRSSDGVTWEEVLNLQAVGGAYVSAILVDPNHHANVYAVASAIESGGTSSVVYRSTDGGQTWAQSGIIATTSAFQSTLAVDSIATNVLYWESIGGVYRSTDSGASWQPTLASMYSLTADPTATGVVYAADAVHIYKSSDFGATWNLLATMFNFTAAQVSSYVAFPGAPVISVDPHDSSTLYAAASRGYCLSGTDLVQCGGLFKSADGGGTWQDLGLAGSYGNVAIDSSTGALYAGGSLQPYLGYVAKSVDGGKTWTPVNAGLTTQAVSVLVDPGDSSKLYGFSPLSSSNSLFRSTNAGGNWVIDPIVTGANPLLYSFGIPAK
jgi:photosystem II stability/assembly factor-like uncharacterized protein